MEASRKAVSQYLLREAGALLGARTERGTRDRRVDRAFDRRAADDSGAQAGDLDREDLITVFPSFVGTDASPVVMPEPPWRLPLHNAPPRLRSPRASRPAPRRRGARGARTRGTSLSTT